MLKTLDRRTFVSAGVAAVAMVKMSQSAADTPAPGGDWFALVKAQHAVIAGVLNQIIENDIAGGAQLLLDLNHLTQLLTAHSVAEENVLYPALATHGLEVGSAELYLEQDAQKVVASIINLQASGPADATNLANELRKLRLLIVEHALEREEKVLYPKLRDRATAPENAALTQNYQKFYSMVQSAS